MTKRAAIYCRLSQDREGAGIVVERQERDCREMAAQLGWSVEAVFVDNDVSAYRRKPRPGYRRLTAALTAGEVNSVLVWHVDRLLRSPRELEDYIDLCKPLGVVTASVRAGLYDLTTDAGQLTARIVGAVARHESDQTAGRSRAGKRDAAARGEWSGGQRVYGYQIIKAGERAPGAPALEVVEAEAEALREASRRVLSGESLRSIARSMNEAGLATTRGRPWTGSALRKVLIRPLSAGLRASQGEVLVKGRWEPLLPEDEWRGLCALLSDPSRRTNTDGHARKYLGSGLYRCGVCGGPLGGNTTAGGGPSGRRAAYRCRAADRDGSSHVVRDVEKLDDLVSATLIGRLGQPDAIAAAVPVPPATAPWHAEAGGLRARLEDAARGWAAGVLTQAQLIAATDELRSRLEAVERRIGAASVGSALAGLGGVDAERWAALPLDRRRAVLDLLAVVTVLPRERTGRQAGGGYWDPTAVEVTWRGDGERSQSPSVGRPLLSSEWS